MRPYLSEDGRNYIINGKHYTRLSQIMEILPNYGLDEWRQKVGDEEAERISRETANWGTQIHLITQYYDLGNMVKLEEMIKEDDSVLPDLCAWIEWVEKYIKKWVAIERIVWSDELMVAGTIDRVDEFKGDKLLSIHDLKTGSLYDEIGVRLAGYKIMWNEREKRKVERYSAVQLPRESPGELRVKEYTNEKYEERFREACETYQQIYR